MKTAALALVLALAAPLASAADCSTLPKIVGIDYHTARAILIRAGHVPIMTPIDRDADGPMRDDAAALGYLEAGHASSGHAWRFFAWRGFTLSARGCEDLTDTRFHCRVISCQSDERPPRALK